MLLNFFAEDDHKERRLDEDVQLGQRFMRYFHRRPQIQQMDDVTRSAPSSYKFQAKTI